MGRISVFGLGYVGTVTAACFAHHGNEVIGVDLSPGKVEAMEAGRSPIVEPKLSDLIGECHRACRLHATSDSATAVLNSDISFLCVGTPSLRNGKLDLGHIEPVCREIGSVAQYGITRHCGIDCGSRAGEGERKAHGEGFRSLREPRVHARGHGHCRFP